MIRGIVSALLRPWLRAKMARYQQQAETAYAAMYDVRPPAGKDCYEDARLYITRAIEMAERANLAADVARLRSRRNQITEVYNRQFRRVGQN
jgi:hypothetical protein